MLRLWSMKRYLSRSLLIIVSVVYILIIADVVVNYLKHPFYLYQTDLVNFLTGAKIIAKGMPVDLYNNETQLIYQNIITDPNIRNIPLPFRNIPLMGLVYVPFTYVSLKTATMCIFAINIGMFIALNKIFENKVWKKSMNWEFWVVVLLFWPFIATLLAGQYMGLMLIIITAIYFSLKGNRHFLTGVLTSLLWMRPQLILMLPFLFTYVRNKKTFSSGFFVSTLFIFLVNVFISDISTLAKYPKFVMSVENTFFEERISRITSVYFLFKDMFPSLAGINLMIINMVLYLFLFAIFHKRTKHLSLEINFIVIILTTVLFSIHVLSHDQLLLLIPIYLIIPFGKTTFSNYFKNKPLCLLYFAPFINLLGVPIVATLMLIVALFCFLFPENNQALNINSNRHFH